MRPGNVRPAARRVIGHAAVVAAVLLAALAPGPRRGWSELNPLAIAIIAAATALILLARHRRPLTVFAVVTGISLAATLIETAPAVTAVGLAVAAYAMAAAVSRRRTIIASLLAAALLIVANLVSTAGQLLDPRTFVLSLVAIAAAAIGDSTRSRRSYLEAALERAARAEETRDAEARRRVAEERLRIARDLHDAVGHRMTVINLHAAVATSLLREDPDEAARSLTIIGESARTVLAEIHELLKVLRSDEGGRETPGTVGLAGLSELVDDIEKTGARVAVRRTGRVPSLDGPRDAVAYRVLQESLVNARRHGSGATIEVHLHGGADAYELTVVNDTDDTSPRPDGHGLRGMRERVEAAGGSMVSGHVDGLRYEVAVSLPARADARLESP